MKFDRSNKFDFCYYGQVNSPFQTLFYWGDLFYLFIYFYSEVTVDLFDALAVRLV